MRKDDENVKIAEWYISNLEKALRIKDKVYKKQIIDQIRPSIEKASKRASSKADMIREMGDPRNIAGELSDPRNWTIDIGTPLSPGKEIKSFFSYRGRIILMLLFMVGLVIPIALFIFNPETGWVLPSLLVAFVALWALGISFLNNFLGYIGTAVDLKRTDMKIDTIDSISLKRYIAIFIIISLSISIFLGTISVILDPGVLSISFSISLSTSAATLIAARMMYIEGRKAMDDN
jgi:uncharacterized membrane protein